MGTEIQFKNIIFIHSMDTGIELMKSIWHLFKWSETRLGSRSQPFFHLVAWWSPMDLTTMVFYGTAHEEGLRLRISWVVQIVNNIEVWSWIDV